MYLTHSICICVFLVSVPLQSVCAGSRPLTRRQAVELALESNPRVAAAYAEWQAARSRKLIALAPEDPELEIEYEELPGVFDTGRFGERSIGITQRVEWPLKWWYRQRASAQRAESVRYSVYGTTRLDVEAEVCVAFDRILADREIVAAAEGNLLLAKDLAAKSRTRFDAGDVPRLAVMRSEVQVGLSENAVAEATAALEASRASLAMVLGPGNSVTLEVVGELRVDSTSYELETLKRKALDQRPDLRGAQHALSRARLSRLETIAALLPDLSLGVSRQTIGEPGTRSSFWRTTFGIKIPIWAPFRQRGEVSVASAEARRAEAEHENLKQEALGAVVWSHAALEAARNRVKVLKSGVLKLAEAAVQAASESYRQGKATYLEVLETQRALTKARIAHTEALFDYHRSRAELERAVGGSL